MKVPLKWLADHVDLAGVPLPELVDRLTLSGLEVANVRLLGVPKPDGLKVKVADPARNGTATRWSPPTSSASTSTRTRTS